ncbi:MAG: c(7)-type cytochrome triheme domain-containing protein [Dissulfurispiraceae bacterium]
MNKLLKGKFLFGCCMFLWLLFLIGGIPRSSSSQSHGNLALPPLPSPETYGDILLDRDSTAHNVDPVVFSHWAHRPKFTCRVCHLELEFPMRAGEAPIVCNGVGNGRFCFTCHDGKTSFALKDEKGENCKRCHNVNASIDREKFREIQKNLPRSKYGNEIDWVKALKEGLIKPKASLREDFKEPPMHLDRTLKLRAEMYGIPPGVFPHGIHEKWLDCSMCHPDIFNIRKKSDESLRMSTMVKGKSCGVCHLKVSFPLNDCKRCHPGMRGGS